MRDWRERWTAVAAAAAARDGSVDRWDREKRAACAEAHSAASVKSANAGCTSAHRAGHAFASV